MNSARTLYDRLWDRYSGEKTSETSLARARQIAPSPLSPSIPIRASRARVTNLTLGRRGIVRSDQPRWCDLSSTLFWLRHRGWLALDVDGVVIEGEAQWRAWVAAACLSALMAIRDQVADGGTRP